MMFAVSTTHVLAEPRSFHASFDILVDLYMLVVLQLTSIELYGPSVKISKFSVPSSNQVCAMYGWHLFQAWSEISSKVPYHRCTCTQLCLDLRSFQHLCNMCLYSGDAEHMCRVALSCASCFVSTTRVVRGGI